MPDLQSEFAVLFVCTGNVCRSPAAERLFAMYTGTSTRSRSGGTYAMVGQSIEPGMVPFLREAGAPTEGFAAQQLTEQHIRYSNLVLVMTRDHRSAVVEMWPSAVRRTFTFLEFARLVQLINIEQLPPGDAATRLLAAIPLAAAQRRQISGGPEVDDIADPYGKSDLHYAAAFEQIHTAVRVIGTAVGFINGRSHADQATLPRRTS